jgi:hypothetical protein
MERVTIFLRHNSYWWDTDGPHRAAAHSTVSVPRDIAELAIRSGNGLDPASETAKTLLAAFGCAYAKPPLDQCIDLAGAHNPDVAPRTPQTARRRRML